MLYFPRSLTGSLLRDTQDLLITSRLCQPESWPSDIDEMAGMYDTELTNVLDALLPKRQFVRRPRPTDPWFDKECRDAKRATRRLERKFAASTRRAAVVYASVVGTGQSVAVSAATFETTAAKAAWYNQRRLYRQLRLKKCSEYT